MAARKFKFVSPGVFLKEVDNSQLPKLPGNIGPVIIGRTRKGPALNPVKVDSYADFVEMFGEAIPGNQGDDIWRDGNGLLATAYANYAAKAYFSADIDSPVTMVRLLGIEGDNADGTSAGSQPGWTANSAHALITYVSGAVDSSVHQVAGIFYLPEDTTSVHLVGKAADGIPVAESAAGRVIRSDDDGNFTVRIKDGTTTKDTKVNFTRGSKNYIRDVLNTNPVATNSDISYPLEGTLAEKYWLGETFEQLVSTDTDICGYIAKLTDGDTVQFRNFPHEAAHAKSGWVFCQNQGVTTDYDAKKMDRLFRVIALAEGEEISKNIIVSVEDIRVPQEGDTDPYGSFSIVVRRVWGTSLEVVEAYTGCNLNPNSSNYVARQVGDQYFKWSASEKRSKVYGNHVNNSRYIRMEMDPNIDAGLGNPSQVPFGFYGPIIPKTVESPAADGTTGKITIPSDTSFIENGLVIHGIGAADANRKASIAWPALQTTVKGSVTGNDYFGAAVYKLGSTNDLTGELDKGMIDYIRALPKGYTSDTIKDGVAGDTTQYAFLFSLDDIILTGDNLNTTAANVKSATHVSGSGAGPTAATATITCKSATKADYDDTKITLISADGTSRTYAISNGGSGTGAVVAGTKIRVNVASASSAADVAAEIKTAIDHAHGHTESRFTVTRDGAKLTITQVTTGSTGNTTIAALEGGGVDAAVLTVNGGVTATKFSGGKDPSLTALHGPEQLLALEFNKFQMPLVGGFDGVDITEADPFANRVISNKTTANNYAFASVDRAIELIRDPEMLEHNIALMPGITNRTLVRKLVDTCESRADSLALIDLPDIYLPPHEKQCKYFDKRIGTDPDSAAKDLKKEQLNSSYGAAYYPWVKIRDTDNSRDVWVPPSVVALGVMAYTEQRDEVWFAPAGFNRGGLNEGNAGLPVLQVSEQLLSKQRDTLYEANINPIASFVTEGLVIFGQKTLQTTPSALDRINVRRLLIFVKKEISRIASNLLFDQNVPATWNRFLGQVNPFLQSVKTRLGLSDYKVILDNTTTTPDLIDRNVMYAKIFLKPARAIEFIAVDFVITNTGASFDD